MEIWPNILDVGGDGRVGQQIDALRVQAICNPDLVHGKGWVDVGGLPDNAPLSIFPKNREEGVA